MLFGAQPLIGNHKKNLENKTLAIITGIESQNIDISIDKFIQCVYGLEYEIIIEKIN